MRYKNVIILIKLFLSTEIFSKKRNIYAWLNRNQSYFKMDIFSFIIKYLKLEYYFKY